MAKKKINGVDYQMTSFDKALKTAADRLRYVGEIIDSLAKWADAVFIELSNYEQVKTQVKTKALENRTPVKPKTKKIVKKTKKTKTKRSK